MLRDSLRIARKELAGFFSSPAAFLFLGAFLGATLFVFFWAEAFFARNIADVRPLFEWMPLLMIFLVAALTMRAWAEERRAGTLELLLTAPVSPSALVLGKFLGGIALVAIALLLTLPLPLTVSFLGALDWGPVIGGYVAALFLASAYVAIGLWVSSRTDNQIVSLILSVLIAGAFYLLGSDVLTNLVGHRIGELLRELGAGSRFDSITRGVLDLRDLYFYLSITATFLVLNRLSLERLRWANNAHRPTHRQWHVIASLLVVNLLSANLWLGQVGSIRADLTQGRLYTLSDATRNYLEQLNEPLLIRGYFSASTHPLLAPLVPQLRDLLEEYAVAGGNKVRVEFVDPQEDPELEEEAGSKYGIRPVPFQTSSKYEASVVNSYFDILVAYGDQYEVLNFRDLIEVKSGSATDIDVELKNPEYNLTGALRKVLASYQGGGSPFDSLSKVITFTGYISSPETLPQGLGEVREALNTALNEITADAGDKFNFRFEDPSADASLAERLAQEFGFRPMAAGLFSPNSFWFYLTLSDGQETIQVPLPETLDVSSLKQAMEAASKRFSPGFLKTIAVSQPKSAPGMPGMGGGGGPKFNLLRESLSDSVRWMDADLESGRVPAAADMLLVLAPENLGDKARFAIDQFLMQGGSVLLSTAPIDVQVGQRIDARKVDNGLSDWLAGHGLSLSDSLTLDAQSGALPMPVERNLGGYRVREMRLANYPYIADLRGSGLNPDSSITAGLGQLYLPWGSAIDVNSEKTNGLKVTTLLRSSEQSWQSDSLDVQPDFQRYPRLGFTSGTAQGGQTLAVMLEGRFESAFKGQPSPLLAKGAKGSPQDEQESTAAEAAAAPTIGGVIERSSESARLILVGSNALFSDQTGSLIGQALGTAYTKPAEFALNLVDWSLEDQGLLSIRSRGHFARTLMPLERDEQTFWEFLNYGLAAAGLLWVWWLNRQRRRLSQSRYALILQEI